MENLLIALQDLLEISYRHHVMCLEEKSFFSRWFSEILEILEPHLSSAMGLSHAAASANQMGRVFYTPAVVLLHTKDTSSERRIDSNPKKPEMRSK